MLKGLVFGGVSLAWIAICWFFASMVALSEAGPKATIAQDACANRLMRAAQAEGRPLDRMTALYDSGCKAEHDRVLAELSRPYLRNGLLIGILPVLIVGLLLFRARG
jgi:hypothetical protein